ncbi:unnamed protein product [Sphagnum troendelagicum]
MTSKKGNPFQKAHAPDFTFKIISTDTHGDVMVWCLFYLYQGRDVVETKTHTSSSSTEIIDVSIGDLFFRDAEQLENIDADDGEQNSADTVRKKLIEKQNEKKNAMKLFCKEDDALVYTVTIKDILHFNLTMDYIGIDMSFRQTAAAIQKAKDRTKTVKVSGLNDRIVDQYMRVLVMSRCSRSSASSTMNQFGPCRWLATEVRIATSHSSTCMYMSIIAASWSTCTSS